MRRLFHWLIIIIVFGITNSALAQWKNNTTFSDERVAKILGDCGCPLAKKKGVQGLNEIAENLKGFLKDSTLLNHSPIATLFCIKCGADHGKKINKGKIRYSEKVSYKVFPRDSPALKAFNKAIFKACFPKKFHHRYEKEIYPKAKNLSPLSAVITKIYSKQLFCSPDGDLSIKGNMYLTLFNKKLFELADFLIGHIEDKLGRENTLKIEDISYGHNKNFLKNMLCEELKAGNINEKEQVIKYLNKFYGNTQCH